MVGGNVQVLFKPADIADLQHFLANRSADIPLNIIGAASNIIIADEGIKGVVIKLGSGFANISHQQNLLTVGSATLCSSVASYCKQYGLAGLEFFSGIPGSVGGAVAMNAGCYGGDVSSSLISATAIDYAGNIHNISKQDFGFVYRGHNLQHQYIFVEAVFATQASTSNAVESTIANMQQQREQAQPIRAKTGGSTFKNPPNNKAWQLIDAVGMRGYTIGDACFSSKHCNFLINNGKSTAQNLLDLGNLAQEKVLAKFNINLQWEIKLIK
jgi:UDP-N-acetylmuramate dehydrogenase